MLGIPFLPTYIRKIVKEQSVADSVDWLNYYCSSLLLAFFALGISAKQYFGSPIQCWVPNEFKGSWERYAEDYCFVANSYYVPFEQEVPRESAHRQDQISYYRWVPVALAIQALLFWLPNWLWNMLHKQTAINPRAVLNEAQKCRALQGVEREKEIESIAVFMMDTLTVFVDPRSKRPTGMNATLLYLCLKLFYVLNCFGQLMMLNRFLGDQYHSWAWQSVSDLVRGEEWRESTVFPRVIMCDFAIRRLANLQQHTVQCVIMLNLINEKLYFFLHFWLLFVGAVTLANFFYYMAMLLLPSLRTKFVQRNINKRQQKIRGFGRHELHCFVQNRLHPDGILLLHFLRQHLGGRVTYELLNETLRLHWLAKTGNGGGSTDSGECTTTQSAQLTSKLSNASTSPAASEKAMLLLRQGENGGGVIGGGDGQHGNGSYSQQNTYRPTIYGPNGLMYPPFAHHELFRMPSAPPNPFSSASLLRALTGIPSPALANNDHRNSYALPPSMEFIDGGSAAIGGQQLEQNQQQNASFVDSATMNTTPLMQSRRAKSPLITGLGTTGRRQNNVKRIEENGQDTDGPSS